MILSPKLIFSLVGVSVYTIFIAWVTHSLTVEKAVKAENKVLTATIQKQVETNKVETQIVQAKQAQQQKQQVIVREVVREVEKPIYNECVTPDDGVRLIERAIDNGTAPTK